MFENRALRRIYGPRRAEVTGEWRRLHNEELNVLYSSPNMDRVIKSRRMRWVGHVAHTGERRGFWWGKPEGKRQLGSIKLRWIFGKRDVGVWTGSSWLRIGTVGGHL
jgi:hypothetical protein